MVKQFLLDRQVKDAENIAMVSGGIISSALKLAGKSDVSNIVDIAFDTLLSLKSSADILKFSSKIISLKKDFSYFIDTLIMILRDVCISSDKCLINYQYREDDIIQISKLFTANACMNLVEKLCKIYNKLEFNCNLVAVVDQMLLDILEVRFLCQ